MTALRRWKRKVEGQQRVVGCSGLPSRPGYLGAAVLSVAELEVHGIGVARFVESCAQCERTPSSATYLAGTVNDDK